MNEHIRDMETVLKTTQELIVIHEAAVAQLQINIREARLALWKPGNKVRVTGESGNVLAEGRVLGANRFVGLEGMKCLVTREGDLRAWTEAALRDLNIEVIP